MMNAPSRWLVSALVAPIRWYQRLISPMRPATCRFYPSCSAYAVRALEIHGPFVGAWLAIRRIGRCHPWTPGGVDHVPPRGEWRTTRPPYDPGSSSGDAAETDPSATEFRAADGDATRARVANPRPSSLAPTLSPAFGRSTSLISIATPRRQGA